MQDPTNIGAGTIKTTGKAKMRSKISSDGARPPPAFLPPDGTHWAWKSRAREPVAQTGYAEDARQEVWISWCEWRAREMNRLFREHGLMGQPGQIKPETIQDGLERGVRRDGKR